MYYQNNSHVLNDSVVRHVKRLILKEKIKMGCIAILSICLTLAFFLIGIGLAIVPFVLLTICCLFYAFKTFLFSIADLSFLKFKFNKKHSETNKNIFAIPVKKHYMTIEEIDGEQKTVKITRKLYAANSPEVVVAYDDNNRIVFIIPKEEACLLN